MTDLLPQKVSDRKLRLFACACCRNVWHLLANAECRHAVEVAERFADGIANSNDMQLALASLDKARQVALRRTVPIGAPFSIERKQASFDAASACLSQSEHWFADCADAVQVLAPYREDARATQIRLLHDIAGPIPFRQPFIDAHLLRWHDGTIGKLAQAIYDERAFDRLPILGDALEDAGCHEAEVLDYCRRPGVHVRGCWVVDLLLGRE